MYWHSLCWPFLFYPCGVTVSLVLPNILEVNEATTDNCNCSGLGKEPADSWHHFWQ